MTERECAQRVGTTRRFGTTTTGLIRAAKSFGWTGKVITNARWNDIRTLRRRGLWPIVCWTKGDVPHFSVVIKVAADHLVFVNTESGRVQPLPRKTFEALWFDRDTYGRRVVRGHRRIVVVHPRGA